jgi:hypothetical protein
LPAAMAAAEAIAKAKDAPFDEDLF